MSRPPSPPQSWPPSSAAPRGSCPPFASAAGFAAPPCSNSTPLCYYHRPCSCCYCCCPPPSPTRAPPRPHPPPPCPAGCSAGSGPAAVVSRAASRRPGPPPLRSTCWTPVGAGVGTLSGAAGPIAHEVSRGQTETREAVGIPNVPYPCAPPGCAPSSPRCSPRCVVGPRAPSAGRPAGTSAGCARQPPRVAAAPPASRALPRPTAAACPPATRRRGSVR